MPRPTKRSSLPTLQRKRLLQLVQALEVDVPKRAKHEELVDALVAAKSVGLDSILAPLNQDELQAICAAHDLDGSGDAKALISRILGHEGPNAGAEDAPKAKRKKKAAKAKTKTDEQGKGGVLGFESQLWGMADQLWTNSGLQPSEYSTPVLALIFLKYADHKFAQVETELAAKPRRRGNVSKDDYLARGVLFVPAEARFQTLLDLSEGADVGKAVNDAMKAIEAENSELKDVLPKTYAKFERTTLASLLKTFGSIPSESSGDAFGRIYEYFLGNFAPLTLQKGGEYFTPESVVKLIVEIVEPFHGRILDPACGSGGMFIQSARFVAEHKKNPSEEISIHGIEKISQTLRLTKMNLAVHGLSGDIREANTYYEDPHGCVGKFDFVMANPPFNQKAVDKGRIKDDKRRFPFGMPSADNANFLWIQLFYSALSVRGRAGFVMANSTADARGSELMIAKQLIETGAVDALVAISTNFFFTVTLPVTLWFLDRAKENAPRPRRDSILFISAEHIYRQIDRAHRDFSPEQIEFLANIVRMYRGESLEYRQGSQQLVAEHFPDEIYRDVRGLCKAATIEEIEQQGWSLNPGRYCGANSSLIDRDDFLSEINRMSAQFIRLTTEASELEDLVITSIKGLRT